MEESQKSQEETPIRASIRFDPSYVRTVPGLLKVGAIVVDLIGYICIACSGSFHLLSEGEWFTFVAMAGLLISLIFLLFYIFRVIEKFHVIPWSLIEAIYCGVWCFFFITAAIAVAAKARYSSAFGAAAFFGFVSAIIYGVDTFFKTRNFRCAIMPQHSGGNT